MICMIHYISTYLQLSFTKTLHFHLNVKKRKEILSECLMKMNASVCCDECEKIIHNSEVLTIATGTKVCPSVGVIVNGVFTAMTNLVNFECFCNQCHEMK